MTCLLSNITEKHNFPRHGYKRNKYRLLHHGTIVNKRCWFDSYRNSEILTKMKSTRKQFKYKLRWCKRLKDQKSADALAKVYHSDTCFKVFWQNIKKLKKSSPLPAAVGGASGSQKIAEMWKNHFSNLLNYVGNNEYKEFVYKNITCKNSYMNSSQYMCDVNTIQSLMCKLPFNSAIGSDGISAEHICFADSTVALYLSLFFNICILHCRR